MECWLSIQCQRRAYQSQLFMPKQNSELIMLFLFSMPISMGEWKGENIHFHDPDWGFVPWNKDPWKVMAQSVVPFSFLSVRACLCVPPHTYKGSVTWAVWSNTAQTQLCCSYVLARETIQTPLFSASENWDSVRRGTAGGGSVFAALGSGKKKLTTS